MRKKFMRRFRDQASNPTTILAKDFTIRGNIEGKGTFIVGGEVKGDCNVDGFVEVTASAVWDGNIQASDVALSGTVSGDVYASGRLEITGTAKIKGNVSGSQISVAQGALIDGTMKVHSNTNIQNFSEKREYEEIDRIN